MSFLNKNAGAIKGSPLAVALDKSALATIMSTDTYFSDMTKWKSVAVTYKNAHGQKKTIVFDANHANPSANFKSSDKVRSNFDIQSVTAYDFDGGKKLMTREQLIAANALAGLDISFESAMEVFLVDRDFSQARPSSVTNDYVWAPSGIGSITPPHLILGCSGTAQAQYNFSTNTLGAAPEGSPRIIKVYFDASSTVEVGNTLVLQPQIAGAVHYSFAAEDIANGYITFPSTLMTDAYSITLQYFRSSGSSDSTTIYITRFTIV